MKVPAFLLGLAMLAAPAQAEEAKYELSFDGTTEQVAEGEKGRLALSIRPKPGFKISYEAPLTIALDGDGLSLARTKLGPKHAKKKWETTPEFAVDFTADAAGERGIDVDATFFVCDAKICERKKERVRVAVSVEP